MKFRMCQTEKLGTIQLFAYLHRLLRNLGIPPAINVSEFIMQTPKWIFARDARAFTCPHTNGDTPR